MTSRGNLARILNVLSGKENKSWTLLATRYRHTIYLSHVEANEGHLSTYGRRILYWGKRFEVAVTKTDSNGKSDCDHGAEKYGPIKAYPGFYSVVRFQLQNHTILLRAEVDAQTQVKLLTCTDISVLEVTFKGCTWERAVVHKRIPCYKYVLVPVVVRSS